MVRYIYCRPIIMPWIRVCIFTCWLYPHTLTHNTHTSHTLTLHTPSHITHPHVSHNTHTSHTLTHHTPSHITQHSRVTQHSHITPPHVSHSRWWRSEWFTAASGHVCTHTSPAHTLATPTLSGDSLIPFFPSGQWPFLPLWVNTLINCICSCNGTPLK